MALTADAAQPSAQGSPNGHGSPSSRGSLPSTAIEPLSAATPSTSSPASASGADHTPLAILAAGRGERFVGETHKLDAPLTIDGVTMTIAQHAIGHALATGRRTIVVSGAITADLGVWVDHPQLMVVRNEAWADGQATSVRSAIGAAADIGADAVVIGLADQPFITAEAWESVASSRAPIAVATYDGQRRNPVRLADSVWPDLPERGDIGARLLIALFPDLVEEIPCTGSPVDIDTLEELERWQSRSSTSSP